MTLTEHQSQQQDLDLERTAWQRGIEKMLAATPARTFRTADEIDRIDDLLEGLLADGESCGSHCWSGVSRHSAHRGTYSASPRTDRCHVRGHPACREGLARAQLAKHAERLRLAYPSGQAVLLQLEAPDGFGFEDTAELVGRWERRRTVKRDLPPMLGVYGFDSDGHYGLKLLAPDEETAIRVGVAWADGGGESFEVVPEPVSVFEAAVELKANSEASLFELVDAGAVSPEWARTILAEERGRRRSKFTGAFLQLGEQVGVDDHEKRVQDTGFDFDGREDEETAWDGELEDEVDDAPDLSMDRLTTRERLDQLIHSGRTGVNAYTTFESVLRYLKRRATGESDAALVAEIERHLDDLPSDHWTCPLHERCRLEPARLRIRTRFVNSAVEAGRATRDDASGLVVWSDDSWPWWRKLAEPIRGEM